MFDSDLQQEKAIAISVVKKGSDRELAMEHLDELAFLAETAGAFVVEKIYQELPKPKSATVVGSGKLEEIRVIVDEEVITLVIFDDDLSPAQMRNLEEALERKVVDRSGLILDIFAGRAKTQEAKTQVELAQLQYILPRLTRMWTHLSRQYGGIGTKGPGETQIETDRRIIRTRIQKLEERINTFAKQKEQQRKGREGLPLFALVGYTNAGKSTLMNSLTEAHVYTEDKLFATLDTTVRTLFLPNAQKALVSDTVGFIRKLPAHLIASFRSTLAEAGHADILLHVIDVSHKYFREQIEIVNETLKSLNIYDRPIIHVLNKIDKLESLDMIRNVEKDYPNCIKISAKRGINVSGLLNLMQQKYEEHSKTYRLLLPYSDMNLVSDIYNSGEILKRKDKQTGAEFEVKVVPDKLEFFLNKFSQYMNDNTDQYQSDSSGN